MGQVLIRNLPDDVIETYKTKARLKGKSLEQELRDLLEAHLPFTREEAIAFSKEILAMSPGMSEPLSKDEIREGLE
jgi:plasmid stability protein